MNGLFNSPRNEISWKSEAGTLSAGRPRCIYNDKCIFDKTRWASKFALVCVCFGLYSCIPANLFAHRQESLWVWVCAKAICQFGTHTHATYLSNLLYNISMLPQRSKNHPTTQHFAFSPYKSHPPRAGAFCSPINLIWIINYVDI